MQELAFVTVDPFDLRPLPFVENARAVDKYIRCIFNDSSILVDSDLPLPGCLIPNGISYPGAKMNFLIEAVLIRCSLDVVPNFWTLGVKTAPVWIRFKGECIDMRWYVTGISSISI
jgi:hypothetical protein